jgi:hypothetical protein
VQICQRSLELQEPIAFKLLVQRGCLGEHSASEASCGALQERRPILHLCQEVLMEAQAGMNELMMI